jgi:hypothetical protein
LHLTTTKTFINKRGEEEDYRIGGIKNMGRNIGGEG